MDVLWMDILGGDDAQARTSVDSMLASGYFESTVDVKHWGTILHGHVSNCNGFMEHGACNAV